MDWCVVLRVAAGMSSRDVQANADAAEESRGVVVGSQTLWPPRTLENELSMDRTYINARDRRKGNAVVAVTIRCRFIQSCKFLYELASKSSSWQLEPSFIFQWTQFPWRYSSLIGRYFESIVLGSVRGSSMIVVERGNLFYFRFYFRWCLFY